MTLENLLAIHRLQAFEATSGSVLRLLASAERNLVDAHLTELSNDNRFDAAYKTIMQCAMIGLWAKGFRTSTSQPGHHQTALQVLPKTLEVAADTVLTPCVNSAISTITKVTPSLTPRFLPFFGIDRSIRRCTSKAGY